MSRGREFEILIPPIAEDVEFDNSTNGFISDNVQDAIEEVRDFVNTSASPGFTWGNSGNTTNGTWLLNDEVPSNKSGRAIFLTDAKLKAVFIRCENTATFDLEIYEHDGTTFTLISTVSVVGSRFFDVVYASPLALTTGKELAIKLVRGFAKNPVAGCIIEGLF